LALPSPSIFADQQTKWRDVVGGLILAFGDIEVVSHKLWSRYFPSTEPPIHFRERTGKLLWHARQDARVREPALTALESSLRLADRRNTIAHNPMQVQVYRHSNLGRLVLQLAISTPTSDEFITDEQLQARAVAFYLKSGFVKVGSHDFIVGSDRQTDWVFLSPLPGQSQSVA
jgi:hypothetical protein